MNELNRINTLQGTYNQITNILARNNVIMSITTPRPYMILGEDYNTIKEIEHMLEEGGIKIDEYNKKMDEMNKHKLYFDEAYKFTFY